LRKDKSFELAATIAKIVEEKKAKDTLVLHTEDISSLCDYFVVASVDSRTQMRTLADFILKTLKQDNIDPLGKEVDKGGHWTLLDLGDVVIHLFHKDDRAFYQLERFWNHATEVPRDTWNQVHLQAS